MGNHPSKSQLSCDSQPEKVARSSATEIPPHNVRISFVGDCEYAKGLPWKDFGWSAELYIQTQNMSRLMRDGIRISSITEVKNTGVMLENKIPEAFKHRQVRHTRRYIFRHSRGEHAWTAHLFVMARYIQPLSEFLLSDLTAARIAHCIMMNSENLLVYRYNAFYSEGNFQTIQEDQRRSSLWSWFRITSQTTGVPTGSNLQLPTVHKVEAAKTFHVDSVHSAGW
ncbi:hypothetical protein GCG54_00014973 [Colletotrichum gloeosporioides]|uniref:Uncharacterized protein n=1 Tax=Colletotrichum gloeosporioides TaxID=474922 RepID=A0A8H4FH84_COLGL|nr:uncharacterized protein GCG54_00014973 [Colletotrichum gloeosporioides]KAF3801756.1 hypothetical protein GCG54_00014973 [Colletotrichum gloeosporioides]